MKKKTKQTPKKKEKIYSATGTPFTIRQQHFIDEFIKTKNGTQSAIKAGYSPHTAHVTSNQILSLPKVRSEIERIFSEQSMSVDEVVAIHSRNMRQSKHLPTSQTAVRDYYRITGRLDNTTQSVAIQFNISD